MITITEKLDIVSFYVNLSDSSLIDPYTVKINDKTYVIFSKSVAKELNKSFGMRSLQFSNQLYSENVSMWYELQSSKKDLSEICLYKNEHYAMIMNDEVVAIVADTKQFSNFLDIINKYVVSDNYTVYYEIVDNNILQFLILNKNNVGYLVKYYIDDVWLKINGASFINNELYVSPNVITSKVLESDVEFLINDELFNDNSLEIIKQEYSNFVKKSKNCYFSASEMQSLLKYDFDIKVKYEFDIESEIPEYLLDSKSLRQFIEIVDLSLKVILRVFNNSPLFKSIMFINSVSFYEYYKLINNLYVVDNITKYCKSIEYIINSVDTCNYIQYQG